MAAVTEPCVQSRLIFGQVSPREPDLLKAKLVSPRADPVHQRGPFPFAKLFLSSHVNPDGTAKCPV